MGKYGTLSFFFSWLAFKCIFLCLERCQGMDGNAGFTTQLGNGNLVNIPKQSMKLKLYNVHFSITYARFVEINNFTF